ncbi:MULTISPECIES: NAD(P)H-binding protein [Liquorilactobacillus]|nr:NAD(P)H-binding protein [Liquorilactobacillus ghanensis]
MASTIKVVILGGSGFVGRGLLAELANDQRFAITSLSRSGGNAELRHKFPQVTWLQANLQEPTVDWISQVVQADWIIDLIGFLFAKNRKTYRQLTITPLQPLIQQLQATGQTRFIFVSANKAPFFLKNYVTVKKEMEQILREKLGQRTVLLYPGLIYDKDRYSNWLLAQVLLKLGKIPGLQQPINTWRIISRQMFSRQIRQVLLGKSSYLEKRI